MRKILIVPACLLLAAGLGTDVAAQGRLTDTGSRLLDECRTLFSQGDYSAAGSVLDEWAKVAVPESPVKTEEIEFMQVVIAA